MAQRSKSNQPMKFFIPFASDETQAQRILVRIEEHLRKDGFEPLKATVYEVNYLLDEVLISEAVGRLSNQNDELVMAIFKNDRGYLVCTYSRGAVWGSPIIAHYKNVESVIAFDS